MAPNPGKGLEVPVRGPSRDAEGFSVVGIGASAGGLEACRQLLGALPPASGVAIIIVQHLDPTHENLMVDLLVGHTPMTVCQATEGMPVEPNHVYVIPPGAYLSTDGGALHLSQPKAGQGVRLPFDFFLGTLAAAFGRRAVAVVLSGTGTDGSVGLKEIKSAGGLVIAQDPDEAGFNGMPRSAIATGAVDQVLPVARIGKALIARDRRTTLGRHPDKPAPSDEVPTWLTTIIDLLRRNTAHDFTLYKPGTLRRRIEQRMAVAGVAVDDMDRYIDMLRSDAGELDLLGKTLLINVTRFFREPHVFSRLAETIIPGLVRDHEPGDPLRIWIAGCSTGEEAYSLAMLFHEEIAKEKRSIKLRIFASDIDPDAVAAAREGLYPDTIAADVSPARLARFFTREGRSYRVSPELPATVVFAVQDMLADPPFSRLDMVSCRNVLIYLRPEAQEKVISLFHFALRPGGILLLGNAETVAKPLGRFELLAKSEQVYRHIGRSRPGDLRLWMGGFETGRSSVRKDPAQAYPAQVSLADASRRLLLETYAPPAVLINRRNECLYYLGSTDRYLQVPAGHPNPDVLTMARPDVRSKLRSAIQLARQEGARVVIPGCSIATGADVRSFNIAAYPISGDDEALLLVCFVEEPGLPGRPSHPASAEDQSKIALLEREIEATRAELRDAIGDLERSNDLQKAVNDEALSVNEEYQSTNEELLTSKEELQSLNEELTSLNSQLQETLEQQRTTATDLQNVLDSTDVATLFLDGGLNIRFFTPATKLLFRVIPGDIGRPLADLNSLVDDHDLLPDARQVLATPVPIERAVRSEAGAWYIRRILPYRSKAGDVGGVVVTYVDVTERRQAEEQRLASQRMEAVGQLTGGVAHDFNNLLTVIIINLEQLDEEKLTDEARERLLHPAMHAAHRGAELTRHLLSFGGRQSLLPVPTALDQLLPKLREMMTRTLGETVALDLVLAPDLGPCLVDPGQLEIAILNPALNARDAMPKGGRIAIEAKNVTIKGETTPEHAGLPDGRYVSIAVSDEGTGMTDDVRNRAFEPFFTTKEVGKGSGLGLSMVFGFAKQSGGDIVIAGVPAGGTIVTILLPRADAPGPPDFASPTPPTGGSFQGTVLIVEDQAAVREVAEKLFGAMGFRVRAAASGKEAMGILQSQEEIRLLFTDVILGGGMDGPEVATAALRLRPGIKVLYTSGYTDSMPIRPNGLSTKVHLLNKPYRRADVVRAVKLALEEA